MVCVHACVRARVYVCTRVCPRRSNHNANKFKVPAPMFMPDPKFDLTVSVRNAPRKPADVFPELLSQYHRHNL